MWQNANRYNKRFQEERVALRSNAFSTIVNFNASDDDLMVQGRNILFIKEITFTYEDKSVI